MRVKSSLLNISAGLGNQLIITALSFLSRSVFIGTLGIEYLGVNGLFTSMLAMLSLAEAGIGSSIIYSLYKPVADRDEERILRLMRLYRTAYRAIAFVVLGLGLALIPFLHLVVGKTDVEHLYVIYGVFLMNTVLPYFFQYKQSFLNVSQKGYIVTGVYSVSQIVSTALKIAILTYTGNYILFLVADCVITLLTSVLLAILVERQYPFLKKGPQGALDAETKAGIIKNVKAIVLQNIGMYIVLSSDSIIISAFVSLTAVGLYANYKMLIEISRTFLNQIFNNLYHSIGNLVAEANGEKVYRIYKVTMLMGFWLYSLLAIAMLLLIEPFLNAWLGQGFLLEAGVLPVLMLLFMERGMRNSIATVKTTAGIFHQDRFAPIIQGGISLAASLALVKILGIAGVFLGSLIGAVAVPFWLTPALVYRHVFQRPARDYFVRYAGYMAVGAAAYGAARYVIGWIGGEGMLAVALQAILVVATVNAVYLAVFFRTAEFRYIRSLIGGLAARLPFRAKSAKTWGEIKS
ncbi:lipopolysaccharide biosynthesis protein [Paenibacillus aurantiacus]|uniref:Lipopolysaccharide biosynthesis protein n=1 Tax=Paenibacillus aurantiacus TaxID=1936118 RepID=A0ABV5KKF7_9BACL